MRTCAMTTTAKAAFAVALLLTLPSADGWAQTRTPAAAPPPQQQPAAADTAATVRRTTLVVEDIDRAVDFYQRLGLAKASDRTTTANDAGGVMGVSDLPLTADPTVGRLVVLRGANDRLGALGLLAYDKPKLASARGNLAALGTGDIMIVLEVADINDAYRRLSQIGTHFHRTPARYNELGPDGTATAGQRMFAFDPDGHLVEVVQPEAPRR